MNHRYVLTEPPGSGKSTILKQLGYQMIELPFLPSDDRANLILDTINM